MRTKRALATTILVAALAAAAASTAAPPPIAQKQGEAAQVLAEISRIDSELGRTVDAYDGARVELATVDAALRANRRQLARAR